MLTTLFSVTFTSCIDNEVSPVVEAIYGAQADLIAAQAGVQNAEAAYLLAQAEAAQAQAAWNTAQAAQVDAITAGYVENNSYNALVHEQQLLALVATTSASVAATENAMELAQVTFEHAMQTAIAAMEAAGAQIAVNYAYQYAGAMTAANNIWSSLLTAEATLADAQLMVTGVAGSEVSFAYHLAGLENAVALQVANIAASEAALALLESSTPTAAKEALDAQKVSLQSQYDVLLRTEEAQLQAIAAINFQDTNRDTYVSALTSALNDHNISLTTKLNRKDWIATAEDNIDLWEIALADYPAAVAALELAISDAQAVVEAADLALTAANEDKWAADDVLADADADLTAANSALSDLNADLALLNGTYYAAVTNLAIEQAAYDGGIVGVTAVLTAANLALTAGNAAVALAQADYDAKQLAFEANPTGFVWTAGVNGAVGLHADATTSTNSYRNYDDTLNTMSALSLTPIGINETGTYTTYAAYALDAPSLGYDSYYNVGGDDVAGGTNADRLNAATLALTTAQGLIAGLQLAVTNAQFDVDHFGDDLADAQDVYDIQKNLYDNQLALVVAAEAVVEAADLAQIAAADDLAIKVQAVTDADTALTEAEADLTAAEGDLTAFIACDDACIQSNIDSALANIALWTEQIGNIQLFIDAKYAVVAGLLVELDTLGVEYTFEVDVDGYGHFDITNDTVLGSTYSDLRAQLIAANQVLWTIQRDMAAVASEQGIVNNLIAQWNTSYSTFVSTTIPALKSSITASKLLLAKAQAALALALNDEAAAEANIVYLEALVATLEQRYLNALSIAEEYKMLMEAALAS